MQPYLWNAEYAIMYGLFMQELSTKSHNISLKKSCGPLKCLQRLLLITQNS